MLLTLSAQGLHDWLAEAQLADVVYHRVRRELYTRLVALSSTAIPADAPRVVIGPELFIPVKLFLTSRNEALSDSSRLGFERALLELEGLVARARGLVAHPLLGV